MSGVESFPRRQARTRRFTLGAPRSFRVSDDGKQVVFLRSSGPEDTVNALWVLDVDSGEERLAADPRRLNASHRNQAAEAYLPPEERSRRERVRESGSGIVSYDADSKLETAVFVWGGKLWRVDLVTGHTVVLPTKPGVFDVRSAPRRSLVSYVCGSSLRVTGDGHGDREVIKESGATVSWGSAEFVAAEEMGRTRGHWWSPDGRRLLAARVDTAPVQRRWISSPARPETAPSEIRYPAAGTPNAVVGLAVFDLPCSVGGSTRVVVDWAAEGWEYLSSVNWSDDGLLLTVQSRDQRRMAVLEADPLTGACAMRYQVNDDSWVDLVPGTPRIYDSRMVTAEDHGPARRLCVDGRVLTPRHLQIRSVEHVDDSGVIVTASANAAAIHVARVGWDGTVEWLTTGDSVNGVAVGGSTMVISSRSMHWPGLRCTVNPAVGGIAAELTETSASHTDGVAVGRVVRSHAADADLDLNVRIVALGSRRLATAIVLPADAHPSEPLPVLLDPYGGPHAQRVQYAQALYHTPQWFAEQGFAVVVIDGRGTPGRGPSFERAVRGDLASPVLADQIDGLQAAARHEPRLDLSRVAIRGWSFGGYLAALAVLQRPDVFQAAIAGAPVTNWRLYDTHYTERYLGHPDEEPENYERTDLTPLAGRLRRPLLLIHGLADDNVMPAHTLQLSQALLEAGRIHAVLPLAGVTHMAQQETVAENLLRIQLDFLRNALGL